MDSKNNFVGLPFYIFITLTLSTLAMISARALWDPDAPLQTVLFITIIAIYIGMFWLSLTLYSLSRLRVLYYAIQTLLILSAFLILRGTGVATSVIGSAIITIIGEALGLWGNTRRALYLGLFYAALGASLYYFLVDWEQLGLALYNLVINGGFIVILMLVLNQQLAERQKALDLAENLESANAKLAAYAAKIEQLTLQNERQRMARELHDTLAQGVAGLVLQLEAVKMHLDATRTARASVIVDQALARARNTLDESRAAIDDLRAVPVNLAETIREKVGHFTQTTGIPCELDLILEENQKPTEITGHALRILNEALTNVARHAQATQVMVKFSLQNDQLELEIHDNGKGFDMSTASSSSHYGLRGMQERASLTGGSLTIETNFQGGTTIHYDAVSGAPNRGLL